MARKSCPQLHELLEYIVESDGLTNEQLPMSQKYRNQNNGRPRRDEGRSNHAEKDAEAGSTMILFPKFAILSPTAIRLTDMPWCGLLELVRDLIEYAYRDWIAEGAS